MSDQSTIRSVCSPDTWSRKAPLRHAHSTAWILCYLRRLSTQSLPFFLWVVVDFVVAQSSHGVADNKLETMALAEDYVATLDNDLERQANFYSPKTRFRDPTSALFGPAWDITGGEEIIRFFKQASADSGTLLVSYKITDMLVEGSIVVANITSTVTSCGVGL